MKKLALAALLACALGTALGVLSDSARAADEPGVAICLRTGGIPSICAMSYEGDARAVKIAHAVLDRCAAIREPVFPRDPVDGPEWQCFAERAYIKQRWGY